MNLVQIFLNKKNCLKTKNDIANLDKNKKKLKDSRNSTK